MKTIGTGFQFLLAFTAGLLSSSCSLSTSDEPVFSKVSGNVSGINFRNTLSYTEELNPYTFKNFYNGGGVAIGDLNNDGLPEIFFAGNLVSNKLYLNEGGLKFEDITKRAGVESENVWSTGVSLIDINADGFLDIYICKSGPPGVKKRHNELFINNGDLTFTEQAAEFGLDNLGLSVHASFLDYDKDGDLDCYLLNNAIKSIGSFGMSRDQRLIPDTLGANKFYRNDKGFFNDITLESGIYSSEIGFGLGATVGDINEDNWPDIYISNDFYEKDYLYINQKDGTFEDRLESYITEISMGSMGADLADINNDGLPEYFVTEMLPERRDRQVTKAFFDTWEGFNNARELGYYHQFGRNVLQLNNGDGTFSEIGRYAGVEATDWSWAALILDVDNDGLKDIFIANGIYKDLLDLDYLTFMANPRMVREKIQVERDAIKSMIDMMPSEPVPNYLLRNNGDLTFTNKAPDWGLGEPTFSNGSAYGDLDNDGDLDLVVNNINMPSFIYENRSRQIYPERNHISIQLRGMDSNTMAIGAKVWIYANEQIYYQELNPIRGFESSVDYKLLFGLGGADKIDSLRVLWPSDRTTVMKDIEVNKLLEIEEQAGMKKGLVAKKDIQKSIFSEYNNPQLSFVHKENEYVDFLKDRLLFHMNSTEGPCICKGDVNNDGLDDFYIGGAGEQSGKLFIQSQNEVLENSKIPFLSDSASEDIDCAFFDANNDGNKDLYVATGGSEFGSISIWLNDRLYFGDGKGGFVKSDQRLPDRGFESTSVVLPFDYDEDGDLDLFVGGRSVPYFYGIPATSYLLVNDGEGIYKSITNDSTAVLNRLGMVTDATFADMDGSGKHELIVVGRWMPVKILSFSNGVVTNVSDKWDLEKSDGWYNTVKAEDLNGDGSTDILVGNHGLNTRFYASVDEPLDLWVGDLDNNGTLDQIISMYQGGEKYPFTQLKELTEQIPMFSRKYISYSEYKNDKTDDILTEELRRKGQVFKTYNLASGFYLNKGGKLVFRKLPFKAQLSPVYAFQTSDFNGDGYVDLVLGGNFWESKPEVGSYLASFGNLLLGDPQNGGFRSIPNSEAGFSIDGAIRDVEAVKIGDRKVIIFTRNNDEIFSIQY